MSMFLSALSLIATAHEPPPQTREQPAARREARTLPLSDIQRRVIPAMGGAKYLGFDFDHGTAVYTLKFLRDGSMIWVMVDGRSGEIIGRSR